MIHFKLPLKNILIMLSQELQVKKGMKILQNQLFKM
jgi:hypothetical protein